MDTIFINSGISKTSESQRLVLNLANKMNIKKIDKCVTLSNNSIYYTRNNLKAINLKISSNVK